ncbi:MAG: SAF domain-containing protein [Acidimicrobiales bacterium]
MLGGLLVAVALIGVFGAYQAAQGGPSGRYVVAATDLAPGSRLTADDLRVVPVDLPLEVAGGAFTSVGRLVGDVVLGAVAEGELIQRSGVADEPVDDTSGFTMSFPIDADRAVGGDIEPGETIAILVTYDNGQDSITELVVRSATVINFDRADDGAISGALSETVLTVLLPSDADPLEVAHAARIGEITVIKTTFAGDDAQLPAEFQPDLPAAGAPSDEEN